MLSQAMLGAAVVTMHIEFAGMLRFADRGHSDLMPGDATAGPAQGPVCYYYGKRDTVYENLGHAEVVKLDLDADAGKANQEMEMFASTYFRQFQKTRQARIETVAAWLRHADYIAHRVQTLCRAGMQRLDPQDAGPAYRNVVGLPGGVNSPLFKILEVIMSHQLSFVFKYHVNVNCRLTDVMGLQKKNIHGMKLVAGEGNVPGQLKEDDRIGVIYVLVRTFSICFICLH